MFFYKKKKKHISMTTTFALNESYSLRLLLLSEGKNLR